MPIYRWDRCARVFADMTFTVRLALNFEGPSEGNTAFESERLGVAIPVLQQ